MDPQFVILIGDPTRDTIGPFASEALAALFISNDERHDDMWVVEIQPPAAQVQQP